MGTNSELKSKFGSGLRLTLELEEENKIEELNAFMTELIPSAERQAIEGTGRAKKAYAQ